MNNTPRVILVVEDWPQLIYLAEALSRRAMQVVLVGVQGQFTKLPKIDSLETHCVASMTTASLAPVLQRLCAQGMPRYIIPMTDDAIRCCWLLAPAFQALLFPQLTADHLDLIGDKANMSAWARQLGVLIPDFVKTPTPEDALAFAHRQGFPVVVKGATGRGGSHVRFATNSAELLAALNELAHDQPSVQQCIQGVTLLGGGLFENGKPLRLQLCEKTLTHPKNSGPSIKVRSVTHAELRHDVETICAGLSWTGFASMDFIWNGKDLYFLELNPRPWGCITTATTAGPELFEAFAHMLHGEPVKPNLTLRKGVEAFVFPGYAFYLVTHGSMGLLLQSLVSPSFWRSVPHSWRLFVYFLRRTAWAYMSREERNK